MTLQRTCIVDLATGLVVNVIDYDRLPKKGVPGYGDSYRAIPSDTAQIGDTYKDGAFVSAPNHELLLADYRLSLHCLLLKSDNVAMRCFKSGKKFPVAWKEFTELLRDRLKEQDVKPLPDAPELPKE